MTKTEIAECSAAGIAEVEKAMLEAQDAQGRAAIVQLYESTWAFEMSEERAAQDRLLARQHTQADLLALLAVPWLDIFRAMRDRAIGLEESTKKSGVSGDEEHLMQLFGCDRQRFVSVCRERPHF